MAKVLLFFVIGLFEKCTECWDLRSFPIKSYRAMNVSVMYPTRCRRRFGICSSLEWVDTVIYITVNISLKVFVHYTVSCQERKRNVSSSLSEQVRYPSFIRTGWHSNSKYITVNISCNPDLPLNTKRSCKNSCFCGQYVTYCCLHQAV